jgi:hypothetical protein
MKPLISWQGEEGKVGELRARALKEIEQVQSGDLSQAYYMRFLALRYAPWRVGRSRLMTRRGRLVAPYRVCFRRAAPWRGPVWYHPDS